MHSTSKFITAITYEKCVLLPLYFDKSTCKLPPTLKCQINGGGQNNKGVKKLLKFNKRGVKINWGESGVKKQLKMVIKQRKEQK